MPQVKYSPVYDELEITFKESSVTSVHESLNGIFLEFDGDELAYIIAPHFSRSIPVKITDNTNFVYEGLNFSDLTATLIIKMDHQKLNIKIDLS